MYLCLDCTVYELSALESLKLPEENQVQNNTRNIQSQYCYCILQIWTSNKTVLTKLKTNYENLEIAVPEELFEFEQNGGLKEFDGETYFKIQILFGEVTIKGFISNVCKKENFV